MHTQPSLWPWVSPDTGPELPFTKFECFPWCCAGQTYRQRHWGPRPALTPPSAQSQGHRGRLSALGSKGKPRPQGAGAGQRPPFPDLHPGGKGQPCSVRQALPLLEGTAVPTPPEPSPAAGGTPSLPCLSPFLSPPALTPRTAVRLCVCLPAAGRGRRPAPGAPPPPRHPPHTATLTSQASGVRGWPGPGEGGDRCWQEGQPQRKPEDGGRGRKMGERRGGRKGEGTQGGGEEKKDTKEGWGEEGGWGERREEPQALTTSSMMGSGLAASSCSFTFSSTRGRKTATEACWRGPAALPGDAAHCSHSGGEGEQALSSPPLPPAPSWQQAAS